MSTQAQSERITALEVEVRLLKQDVEKMNDKLDQLLALKHKGAGAFWFFSAILGSSVIGAVSLIADYFRS